MGLTREQLHKKREDEIIKYVEEHGNKLSETITYWGTYPVCVKDICVLGAAVKGKKTKKLMFGDLKDKKFILRKEPAAVDHLVLADVLADMKIADNYAAKAAAREAAKKTTAKTAKTK